MRTGIIEPSCSAENELEIIEVIEDEPSDDHVRDTSAEGNQLIVQLEDRLEEQVPNLAGESVAVVRVSLAV